MAQSHLAICNRPPLSGLRYSGRRSRRNCQMTRPGLIRWALAAGVASWMFLVPPAAGVEEIHGPLAIRNQSAIQLLFFQFVPERAVPLGHRQVSLRLDVTETNTLPAGGGAGGGAGRLDLGRKHANLPARVGPGAGGGG